MATTDEQTRRSLHCGWMDESQWTDKQAEIPRSFGTYKYEHDVCPGSLVRTEAVAEGAQAYAALQAGELRAYFPNLENAVLEAAMAAQQGFNEYEAYKIKAGANR